MVILLAALLGLQAAPPIAPALSEADAEILREWQQAVGEPKEGESFGELVVRAALFHKGRPYLAQEPKQKEEALRIRLGTLQCVSLVETSMALAHCAWQGDPSQTCFEEQVRRLRYRSGQLDGYASRLHYFADWIADNEARGAVRDLSLQLGGAEKPFSWSWMTNHPKAYPQLADPSIAEAVRGHETRLSAHPVSHIPAAQVASLEPQLETGDVVAVLGDKKGLLIRHVGLVVQGHDGVTRMLHASSSLKRVVLTPYPVHRYLQRRPGRLGIKVARPSAPGKLARE